MGRAVEPASNSTGEAPIEHRNHRLADGREAVFFSDRGTPAVERVVDARPLGERSGHGRCASTG